MLEGGSTGKNSGEEIGTGAGRAQVANSEYDDFGTRDEFWPPMSAGRFCGADTGNMERSAAWDAASSSAQSEFRIVGPLGASALWHRKCWQLPCLIVVTVHHRHPHVMAAPGTPREGDNDASAVVKPLAT